MCSGMGFTVLGPTVRNGAVVPGRLSSVEDLPRGWGDQQEPGSYRLRRRDDEAMFGYAADAVSWKSVLFPSHELIWEGSPTADGFTVEADDGRSGRELGDPPYGILGIRSCDLHALAIHDRVLRDRAYPDVRYAARRKDAFLITLVCSDPSGTCFCVSMGTGPRAESGYDLALTELLDGEHTFLARAGSDRRAGVLDQLQTVPATERHVEAAEQVVDHTIRHMGRTMDTTDIRTLLYDNPEHPRWDDGQPLSVLRQLHDGVPYLLLHLRGGPHLPVGRAHRALAGLGLVLHHRLLLHARWQRPHQREVPLPAVDDP
jgi:hypothetical protein